MSRFLKGSVKWHLFRLTVPTIAGTSAIMIFSLTDTWYVSRLGTEALAAMGFTFSIVFLVGAMANGFSTGAASIISRALGAGNRELAERTVSGGLILTIAGTLVISTVGYLTIDPLFGLLGAKGQTMELVREYMQVWFIGAGLAIMPPVSDACLRAAGDIIRPVVVMCICAILNILLDPVFIFGLGPVPAYGIKGAAIATVISRGVGASASLGFLHFRHHLIDFHPPHWRALLVYWKEILRLGLPASLTQAMNPIAQGYCVRLAATVGGVHAVAAMATGTRIQALLFIIAIAYSIAIVPFVGYNYGARAFQRVHEARRLSIWFAFIYSGIILLVLIPTARPISSLFSDVPEVIQMSTTYLLIVVLGHAGMHLNMWMSQLLNIIGKPLPVIALNLSRVLLLMMPLTYLGSRIYGFTGLVIGLTMANLLAGALATIVSRRQIPLPD